jgi:kinesin family protein 2/24
MQVCKLPQKEFVSRCLQTRGVKQDQASAFYQKLWRTRIDSRQRSSAIEATERVEPIEEPQAEIKKTPFQERIRPGMFVRLVPGASKAGLEGAEIFMIMLSSRPEDFDGSGEERQFICAAVGPSIMTDAYELHVAIKDTLTVKDMAAEVLMEYDSATRYYYMDL